MKTALLLNIIGWILSGFIGVHKGDPDYFQRFIGAWMCIGFYGVIDAIESKRIL